MLVALSNLVHACYLDTWIVLFRQDAQVAQAGLLVRELYHGD